MLAATGEAYVNSAGSFWAFGKWVLIQPFFFRRAVSYYVDLTPCDYFGRWQEVLIAIGWLEPGHSFETGKVSKEFFAQLIRLLRNPWQPVVTAGHQRCSFCQFTGGPSTIHFEGSSIFVGTANLFIPATGCVYVAPSLIAHYVDAHEYCPPANFQEAVMKCPEMRSFAYLKEMKAHGLAVHNNTDGGQTDGAPPPDVRRRN